ADKRVAVIGTGASAIQFVPEVRREARELLVFQRSAPFVFPKLDREYLPQHQRTFRAFPVIQLAGRLGLWLFGEIATIGLLGNKPIAKLIEWITLTHLKKKVRDKRLRDKLTPDYQVGCKRVLFSNNYYDAMVQPNVELVTERISEIAPNGVRTVDGVEHKVDALILGTGFTATEFLAPMKVRGLGGRDLGEVWHEGARAYLGMTVPDFPNMFLMYGPNTNLGANSIIYMLERQARYTVQAVRTLAGRPGRYLNVRSDVERRFDDEMQRRLRRSMWTLCHSWYRNSNGRVTTNWPGLVSEYDRRTRKLDLTDYRITTAPGAAEQPAA
ncbi:MAG: flavin-containing monooxygenase, partial [Sciscionella sp.]